MRKIFKNLIGWGIAILLGAVIANIVLFFYERPVGWVDTPEGASKAVRKPYSVLVHGTEGYGVTQIDRNGFTNPDYPLNDSYVLMMGSSHTQGKEVASDKKYSVLVNDVLSSGENKLYTYNIACDGEDLTSVIEHFQSAVANFSNASCITIEINGTDFSADKINNAVSEGKKIDLKSTEQIFSQLSNKAKIKNFIKENFPLSSIIKTHMETVLVANSKLGGVTDNTVKETEGTTSEQDEEDEYEYERALRDAFSYLKSCYSGTIVFVYHPFTELQSDGSISLNRSRTIDVFAEICKVSGIDFIDVGEEFVSYYNQYNKLPYGFLNTKPGSGHLNETGHRIIADAILDYLKEGVQ